MLEWLHSSGSNITKSGVTSITPFTGSSYTHRQTDIQTDRQTDRHTDTHTGRHTDTHKWMCGGEHVGRVLNDHTQTCGCCCLASHCNLTSFQHSDHARPLFSQSHTQAVSCHARPIVDLGYMFIVADFHCQLIHGSIFFAAFLAVGMKAGLYMSIYGNCDIG